MDYVERLQFLVYCLYAAGGFLLACYLALRIWQRRAASQETDLEKLLIKEETKLPRRIERAFRIALAIILVLLVVLLFLQMGNSIRM